MSGRYTSSRRDVLKQGAVLGGMAAVGAASFERFVPGTAAAAQLDRSQTLYVAGHQWGPPTTFNPLSADPPFPVDPQFMHLYESLYTFNSLTGESDPHLAAAQPEEDAEGMTITLHEGITFQDGEALTAEDVVYSLTIPERQEGIRYADFLDYVTSVEAVDDLTVRLTYNQERLHPARIRHHLNNIHILPQHIWEPREAEGVVSVVDMEPVGSGPYQVSVASAEQVVLVRYEDYWGAEVLGMPVPMNIVHPIFDSNDAGNLALQRGEVDLSQQFVPQIWQMWEDQEAPVGTWYSEEPYYVPGSIPIIHLNISRPGLDNPAVRRALAHAIPYAQIAEVAMSRYSDVVNPSLIIPLGAEEQFFNADAIASDENGWEYNPDEARRILEEEVGATEEDGVYVLEDGTTLGPWTVQCPFGWTDWMTALELVAQGAQDAGFDITTEFPEAPVVTTNVQNGDFDIAMWGVTGVSAAGPWMRFRDVMDNRGVPELGQTAFWNYNRFKSEEAEQLLDQAATAEGDELVEIYTQLDGIFRANVPVIPLMYRPLEFYEFNESVWTGFPTEENPSAPPMHYGSGIKVLYNLEPVGGN
ncbi:MAG TPA: ABC transporter substrate-binding protein [Thermomicrobiales bacterium]|nr:ABC transporter substrate-binding protein [Thermomicrobiales bacterium]